MRLFSATGTLLSLMALIGPIAVGCADDPRADDALKVVAEFGDAGTLLRSELGARLVRNGAARTPPGEARELIVDRSLEKMIEERLLLIAAQKKGILVEEWEIEREIETASADYPPGLFPRTLYAERLTLENYRALVRQRLMVSKFLRTQMETLPTPTSAELRARFDATVKGRSLPAEARVRQVLVKTREEAVYVLQEIRAKRITFEKAALQYSAAPEGKAGGDLGWFAKGSMPRVFDICFTKERGTITDVVESDWGFHLFEIIDTHPAHLETFEEAEDTLYDAIMLERQEAAFQTLMTQLRKSTPVKINKKSLKSVVKAIPPPPEQTPLPTPELRLPEAEPNMALPEKAPKVIDISKNRTPAGNPIPPTSATLARPSRKDNAALKPAAATVKKETTPAPKSTEIPKAKTLEPAPTKKTAVTPEPKPKAAEPKPKAAEPKPKAAEPKPKAAEPEAKAKPKPKAPKLDDEPKGEPPPPEPKGEPEE